MSNSCVDDRRQGHVFAKPPAKHTFNNKPEGLTCSFPTDTFASNAGKRSIIGHVGIGWAPQPFHSTTCQWVEKEILAEILATLGDCFVDDYVSADSMGKLAVHEIHVE